MDEAPIKFSQSMLTAGADVLYAAMILKPEADPVKVMAAVAHLYTAVERVRRVTEKKTEAMDRELILEIRRASKA